MAAGTSGGMCETLPVATPPPEKLTLKFVDGATRSLDLSANRTQDVLEEIDLENGRLDTEALQRGKPWA